VAEGAVNSSGVLLVDKPQGITSFDVVAQARRIFATREVGHAGTLDPMATGVLVLLFGEGTKLSSYLTAASKTYEAEVRFGVSTDTLDADGTALPQEPQPPPTEARLLAALEYERARSTQLPPAHSAIKVAGQRAYTLARKGEAVQLVERPVQVQRLELLAFDGERARCFLEVSKGYYVRSFARDVCAELGVAGHLSALRRTSSGCFSIGEAQPWPPHKRPPLLSVAAAAERSLPRAVLSDEGSIRTRHGKLLTAEHFLSAPTTSEACAWFDGAGTLLAIGQGQGDAFRVLRGFRQG
jgi:tRNA pseudouridine55 synthase